MSRTVTAIVPLWGREAFTDRFRRYKAQTMYYGGPTSIFIPEGDPSPAAYFTRVRDALARVQTPYVMLADNDDLLLSPGIHAAVKFLDQNEDFLACGGRVSGFALRGNGPYGKMIRYSKLYSPFDMPGCYDQPFASARILSGFDASWTYYAIHRTWVAQAIWRDVVALGITDLQLHERFCVMRLLLEGKVMGLAEPAYFRQYNTSIQWPNRNSFPARLMSNQFARERDAILDRICGDDALLHECVVGRWTQWWEDWFVRNYGPAARARRWLKAKFPAAAARYKNARRPLRLSAQSEAHARDFLREAPRSLW